MQFAAKIFSYTSRVGAWIPHLVPDAAQERVVHQVLRVEVGREDDELLERHLELLAAGDGEEVVPVFQRQDPAVEQFLGADSCRPKSSIRNTPPFALKWIGAW